MKFANFLFLTSFIFVVNGGDIPWPPKTAWMNQLIDHYDFGSERETFKQRFFYEDKYWNRQNGPIFFYTGNEGPLESFWNNTGLLFDLAPSFNALVVFGEHRYYGKSMPFGENSLKQPGIKFLSISQTVADYAYMITHVKTYFKANQSAVIAFGGSYGGMLAAYMRFKFPNKVDGAIAASAPIYWVSGTGNLHKFFESITKDFSDVDSRCPTLVLTGFRTIQALSKMGPSGFQKIKDQLNLCSAPTSAQQVRHIMLWLRGAFITLGMCDYPYPTNFLAPLPGYPVRTACHSLLGAPSPLAGLRSVMQLVYGATMRCFNPSAEFIECADITGCGLGDAATAWDFQACTQIILADNSNRTWDMFPDLPLTSTRIADYCRQKYGVQPALTDLKTLFWGGDISSASNIIFTNGNLDPWHLGGVLKNLTNSLFAYLIEGGAHHLDLRSANPQDPPSVIQARKLEAQLISMWVKQHAMRLRS